MITVRPAAERGHANHGWLDTNHTFSFADYYDPGQMGFRSLRVINEDRVSPESGFGAHSHQDMEIISYVLEGELGHKDSMGTGSVIRPGEVQRMSAGTGVTHSEWNHSKDQPVHFLQIWIVPEKRGIAPGYEQKSFGDTRNELRLIASRDGRDGSVTIHQDAALYVARLDGGKELSYELAPGRNAWVQVVRGAVELNGKPLKTSDGAAVSGEKRLTLKASGPAEMLLFDLA